MIDLKGLYTEFRDLVARALAERAITVEGRSARHIVLVPNTHQAIDLSDQVDEREKRLYALEEQRAPGPRRIEAHHVAQTLDGFCDYVNRHKGATTDISARGGESPALVATIDFHGRSDGVSGPVPRWCKHTVTYGFPFARSFKEWRAASQPMGKKAFLDWVETHAVELAHPGEIVEAGKVTGDIFNKVLIVRGWDADKRRASFKEYGLSAVFGTAAELFAGAKLMNGSTSESLEETVDDMGQVAISYKRSDKVEGASAKRYYLADIKVFDGDEETRCVPVRLDLQVDGGKLALSLHLIGVEQIVEASFVEACTRVKEATGIAPIRAVF